MRSPIKLHFEHIYPQVFFTMQGGALVRWCLDTSGGVVAFFKTPPRAWALSEDNMVQ